MLIHIQSPVEAAVSQLLLSPVAIVIGVAIVLALIILPIRRT